MLCFGLLVQILKLIVSKESKVNVSEWISSLSWLRLCMSNRKPSSVWLKR